MLSTETNFSLITIASTGTIVLKGNLGRVAKKQRRRASEGVQLVYKAT